MTARINYDKTAGTGEQWIKLGGASVAVAPGGKITKGCEGLEGYNIDELDETQDERSDKQDAFEDAGGQTNEEQDAKAIWEQGKQSADPQTLVFAQIGDKLYAFDEDAKVLSEVTGTGDGQTAQIDEENREHHIEQLKSEGFHVKIESQDDSKRQIHPAEPEQPKKPVHGHAQVADLISNLADRAGDDGFFESNDLDPDYAKGLYAQLKRLQSRKDESVHDLSGHLGHGAIGYQSNDGVISLEPPRFTSDGWTVKFYSGKGGEQPEFEPPEEQETPENAYPMSAIEDTNKGKTAEKPPKQRSFRMSQQLNDELDALGFTSPIDREGFLDNLEDYWKNEAQTAINWNHAIDETIGMFMGNTEASKGVTAPKPQWDEEGNDITPKGREYNISLKKFNAALQDAAGRGLSRGKKDETSIGIIGEMKEFAEREHPKLLHGPDDPVSNLIRNLSYGQVRIPQPYDEEIIGPVAKYVATHGGEHFPVTEDDYSAEPFRKWSDIKIRYEKWQQTQDTKKTGCHNSDKVASRALGPQKYSAGEAFDESKHPRDEIGRFTEGQEGAVFHSPEFGNRYPIKAKIFKSGLFDTHAMIGFENDTEGRTKVPKESLQHLVSDLSGDMSYLKEYGESEDLDVQAVVDGKAKMIGKGDDSVVFDNGEKVVKASTTVPYHPISHEHMSPNEAAQRAIDQFNTAKAMYKAGVSGIPKQRMVPHGDKIFTVRENLTIPDKLTRDQLEAVKKSIEEMHAAGYTMNDDIQVGIGKDGQVYHFDTGKAEKVPEGKNNAKYRQENDYDNLRRLYSDNGERLHAAAGMTLQQAVSSVENSIGMIRHKVSQGKEIPDHRTEMAYDAIGHIREKIGDELVADYYEDQLERAIFGLKDDEEPAATPRPATLYARRKPSPGQMSLFPSELEPKEGQTRKNRAGHQEVLRGGRWHLVQEEENEAEEPPDPTTDPELKEAVEDGHIQMRRAKAGGEVSDVNGEFYKGGRIMPVHGLFAGLEKPKAKPKKGEGELPTANPEGKGKGLPTARQRSPEDVEQARQEMEERAKWDDLRRGELGKLLWTGDKPGVIGWDVKKGIVPYLTTLNDDQIKKIGEWTRQRNIAEEEAEYHGKSPAGMTDEEVTKSIIEDYDRQVQDTADMLLTKKARKEFPSLAEAVEGIRTYTDKSKRRSVAELSEMNDMLEDATKSLSPAEDYAQNGTRAKAFKEWFGDWENDPENASKVVNKDGEPEKQGQIEEPKRYYHGTARGGFDNFDPKYADPAGLYGPGFYFTEDLSVASQYKLKGSFPKFQGDMDTLRKEVDAQEKHLQAEREYYGDSTVTDFEWAADMLRNSPDQVDLNDFTTSKSPAEMLRTWLPTHVQEELWKKDKDAGEIKEVYLNIRKPFDADTGQLMASQLGIPTELDSHAKKTIADIEADIAKWEPYEHTNELAKDVIATNREQITFIKDRPMRYHDIHKHFKGDKSKANDLLKSLGYDGITHIGGNIMGGGHEHRVFIAFEPTQIKSVDNQGTFDPKDPRMKYAKDIETSVARYYLKNHRDRAVRRYSRGQQTESDARVQFLLRHPDYLVRRYARQLGFNFDEPKAPTISGTPGSTSEHYVGEEKTENGVRLRLNENHRWELAEKPEPAQETPAAEPNELDAKYASYVEMMEGEGLTPRKREDWEKTYLERQAKIKQQEVKPAAEEPAEPVAEEPTEEEPEAAGDDAEHKAHQEWLSVANEYNEIGHRMGFGIHAYEDFDDWQKNIGLDKHDEQLSRLKGRLEKEKRDDEIRKADAESLRKWKQIDTDWAKIGDTYYRRKPSQSSQYGAFSWDSLQIPLNVGVKTPYDRLKISDNEMREAVDAGKATLVQPSDIKKAAEDMAEKVKQKMSAEQKSKADKLKAEVEAALKKSKEDNKTIIVDKPPPGGWKEEDRVPVKVDPAEVAHESAKASGLDPLQHTAEEWDRKVPVETKYSWDAKASTYWARDVKKAIKEGKEVPARVIKSDEGVFRFKANVDATNALTDRQKELLNKKVHELTEEEFLDQRDAQELRSAKYNVDYYQAEIEKTKGKTHKGKPSKAAQDAERQLKFATDRLKQIESGADRELNGDYRAKQYRDEIKKAISKGLVTDQRVIGQHPEFRKARDARERYEKGRHTSFANKSIAVDDSMQKTKGYKIKQQDGKPISDRNRGELEKGMNEIQDAVGDLSDLLRHTDITLAHTNMKNPFLTVSAGGLYHPNEKTITTGVWIIPGLGFTKQKSLAHEIGHWLDYEAGKASGFSGKAYYTSSISKARATKMVDTTAMSENPKENDSLISLAQKHMNHDMEARQILKQNMKDATTDEEKAKIGAAKFKLGAYYNSKCEIWARLFEQYVGDHHGMNKANESHDNNYFTATAYWDEHSWKVLKPLVKAEIDKRINAIRGSIPSDN